MAKKPTTEAAVKTPGLDKFLDVIKSLKPQVDEIGNNCLQIKVVDDSTLTIAQQNLSKAHQVVKSIEEKRKEAKQPVLDAGKLIDSTCKKLVEVAEKAILHVKNEIKAWEDKRQEEARKAQEEADAKAAVEAAKIAAEETRKKGILDYINTQLTPYLQQTYDGLKTVENCDNFLTYINTKFPGAERFQEFLTEANNIKDTYITLIQNKREQFLKADSLSVAEKDLLAAKEALAKEKQEVAAKELALKAAEDAAKAERERKEAEEKAETEKLRIQAESEMNKTKNTRELWKFELSDKSKVPLEWLCLDEAKVKEYLKEKKDTLKDGETINGVKFFKETIVVA